MFFLKFQFFLNKIVMGHKFPHYSRSWRGNQFEFVTIFTFYATTSIRNIEKKSSVVSKRERGLNACISHG